MLINKGYASSGCSAATSNKEAGQVIWLKFGTDPLFAIPPPLRPSTPLSTVSAIDNTILLGLAALAARVPNLHTFQHRLLWARASRQLNPNIQQPLQSHDVYTALGQLDLEETQSSQRQFVMTPYGFPPPALQSSRSMLYSIPAAQSLNIGSSYTDARQVFWANKGMKASCWYTIV